jgi:putative CocE/NonD family hydrolase
MTAAGRRPPWSVRMLTTRTRRTGPAPRHEIAYRPDLVAPNADGGDLLADHWFPVDDGPFPTVLIRSPYGRGFPWAGLYGARLAEQGFHVLLQACRDSRDGAELWRHEAADGHAAVAWLRRQPWFTGAFGTVGPSYLAYVQWALALDPPPELRAVIAQVGVHDPHDGFYPGGGFALENALVAGIGMTSQARGAVAFLRAALRLRRHLGRITRTLPLRDAYMPGFGRRVAVIEGPLTHPEPDDAYWAGTDVGAAADTVTVPVTLISGWHDIALDQTLRQYARLRAAAADRAVDAHLVPGGGLVRGVPRDGGGAARTADRRHVRAAPRPGPRVRRRRRGMARPAGLATADRRGAASVPAR